MKLWVCGQESTRDDWEFCGIFDSEEKAATHCKNETYFIGPITLNQLHGLEPFEEWQGAYYPRRSSLDKS